MTKGRKFYRINQYIQAAEVRVIDATGKQVGVMPLVEALAKAREATSDLVMIAESAKPPVCKIINFKKFLFQEEKKEAQARKKEKRAGEIKEVRLSPFIAENDLNFRIGRIKEFLGENNKVRVAVIFKTRELGKKDFGYKILSKVFEQLKDAGETEVDPKFFGKRLEAIVRPATKRPEKPDETKTESPQLDRAEVQNH